MSANEISDNPELLISLNKSKGIDISIANKTKKIISFCYNGMNCSAFIEIKDSNGKILKWLDRLSMVTSSSEIYQTDFVTLKPNEVRVVMSSFVSKNKDNYRLVFGRWHFNGPTGEGVPLGTYLINASFESQTDHYLDNNNLKQIKMPNVWIGKIKSKPFHWSFTP